MTQIEISQMKQNLNLLNGKENNIYHSRILTVVQNENQIDQDIEKQMFISS